MKRLFFSIMLMLSFCVNIQAKDLVVYFSAQGHTQAIAEEIAKQTGADILRIQAAEPYAANPYDDSQRIQNEAYNDLRPGVANLPTAEYMAQYDRIFVGSPTWWHQPAMVVCTFLEAFDLSGKTIVPFFTYGATTYLNESMHKIYKLTPNSKHVPETLPEDLNPDDITTSGPADDAGIDMPSSARGVESWLKRLGLTGESTAINPINNNDAAPFELRRIGNRLLVMLPNDATANRVEVARADGTLMYRMQNNTNYDVELPQGSVYMISVSDLQSGRRYTQKMAM